MRHSRGGSKNSGKKITGLAFMPGDDRKLLVTSNDSRVRVYDGYHLACKYKGHKNNNSQIRASFSPGAEFIVCGSEDENVYVWSTVNSFVPSINPIYTGFRRDKHSSYESFRANGGTSDITTAALFAPKGVRDARAGRAAARWPSASRRADRDQASRAAAALFRGGPQSPMDAAAAGGTVTEKQLGDEALGDDAFVTAQPQRDPVRRARAERIERRRRVSDARESPGDPDEAATATGTRRRRRRRRASARSRRPWPSARSSSPRGTRGRFASSRTSGPRSGCEASRKGKKVKCLKVFLLFLMVA